ncbi:hypothetical protein F5148DRAFT_366970 [Russula earlei]|uniref:Uncharacterized protein n=1 Tax=Russula earlei TaxID=71964 RepID=A0ACC0U0R7_9AGAM|nr:hypothetical protein F5148DRAFT_366970 [Russula earlei]
MRSRRPLSFVRLYWQIGFTTAVSHFKRPHAPTFGPQTKPAIPSPLLDGCRLRKTTRVTMMPDQRLEGQSGPWIRTNRKSYLPRLPCSKHSSFPSSDSERPSSGPKRRPPFDDDGDDDDDDDDDLPIVLELEQPASAAVNPIRQPSAFAPPSSAGDSSSGPTFFLNSNKHINNNSTINKTPIHAAVSADGTSMFCVEGYVNTPELSAGRGGGLSQGLPASGPYKSLFRARSESRASNKASAAATAAPVAPAPDAALYVLAEAAQSPDALSSRVSTASPAPARSQAEAPAPAPAPAPAHTSRNHRKPSPPAASSSPASSVTPFDPFSAARPSSAVSANASPSHIVVVEPGPPQRPVRGQSRGGGTTGMESTHRERRPVAQVAAQPDRSGIDRVEPRHDERRHSLPPPRQSAPSAAEPPQGGVRGASSSQKRAEERGGFERRGFRSAAASIRR